MATKKKSTNNGVDMTKMDIDAIDRKFEKLDRETIAKMTGTGSELDKKKTAKKKVKKR